MTCVDDLVEGKQGGFLEGDAFELSRAMGRIVADGGGVSAGCTKTWKQEHAWPAECKDM